MAMSLTYDDITLIPREKSLLSRSDPDTTFRIKGTSLSAPIIAAPMDTVCNGEMGSALAKRRLIGIVHRFQTIEQQRHEVIHASTFEDIGWENSSNIGFAVGVDGDYKQRIESILEIVEDQTVWICFDTANGFTAKMEEAIIWFNKTYGDKYITIAGNVASREGYKFLSDLGVDIVRVGIGSGSPCTTSIVTGCGAGMVSAIQECVSVKSNALILADGGIRSSGDIAKALAVGADLVMCGSLFAGFAESPGEVKDGYKVYRGMASAEAAETMNKIQGRDKKILSEGVTHKVPYKGSVLDFIPKIIDGLKVSMSYMNSKNLQEFHEYFKTYPAIEQLTYFSHIERKPHIYET